MLEIRAIKLEVNTEHGLYGAEYEFSLGLNIIRGDNTAGKSTLFQSILYGLGFEELLGGKNEKTMQSVLKDAVEFPDEDFHNVLQSFIYLEIANKDVITIRRSVISSVRRPQLVDVYFGPLLTRDNAQLNSQQMYVHDKGGASDETYGFHTFLAEFLDWQMPEIITTRGDTSHLYLQQIASAFIIEQKTGWSDFFATIPYYATRNASERVVEFLLSLDVFENEKVKQRLLIDKQLIGTKWSKLHALFNNLSSRSGGFLRGLEEAPMLINNRNNVFISFPAENGEITIDQYYKDLKEEYKIIENQHATIVGNNVQRNEARLKLLFDRVNNMSLNYEMLSPELNLDREKLKQYTSQLNTIKEDLRKNKGALKIRSLGASLPTELANNICPTCHQEVKDSLLPININQTPMLIEDNIKFLEAQQKMIEVYIDGQRKIINEKTAQLQVYENVVSEARQEIRSLKKELTQDERLPSTVDIERKINLKNKVDFYQKIIEEFEKLTEDLVELSKSWEKLLSKESKLSKDFLSIEDRQKITSLQENFKAYLKLFNYQSKPFEKIRITQDTYLPVALKMDNENLFYSIKFDSSASDFIRCLWAYYIALLKTAIRFNTSHPFLLVFDEPKQQDIAIDNFKVFLSELAKFHDQQVIVFASFENSDDVYEEVTSKIQFKLNRINSKLVQPIQSADLTNFLKGSQL